MLQFAAYLIMLIVMAHFRNMATTVVTPSAVMLSVILKSVVRLIAVQLNVIMLNVVAPKNPK
jgi:hypothetical protein